MIDYDNIHATIKFLRFTGCNDELLRKISPKVNAHTPGSENKKAPVSAFLQTNEFGELEEFKNKGILTRKEVLYILGITPPTLDKWVSKGVIPKYGIEGKIFFKWQDLERALVRID